MSKDLIPFSESPYDWGKSTKIITGLSEETDLGETKLRGYHSDEDRIIHVSSEEKSRDRLADTLAHEVSHWRLGHKDNPSKEDLKREFRGYLLGVYGLEGVEDPEVVNLLEALYKHDLVEFEARIYQKERGYYQYPGESFQKYLAYELLEYNDYKERISTILVALQAVNNLVKRGHLSKSRARWYRRKTYAMARKFGVRV